MNERSKISEMVSQAPDKSPARIRRMFGEIAARYDFLNHLLSAGIDRAWRRRTVRRVAPEAGAGPILDVCTGTGDLALAYAKAHPVVPIVGVDFCPEMLAVARKKCVAERLPARVHLIEADAERLPFQDGVFAIVCVAFGLRNVGDTDRGLREMTRVCRPGGRVAILEFSTPTWWPMGRLYAWYFHYVLPWIGQMLARNRQSAYNYLPASVGHFPQGAALVERMRAAGLSGVQQHRFTFGIATLSVGTK